MATDRPYKLPLTILVDTAEGAPWQFKSMILSPGNPRPLIVPTLPTCLGRYPESNGDYSVQGYVGEVGIERKSIEDLQSTVLGWHGRRSRFENELARLNEMDCGMVIVEGLRCCCLSSMKQYGEKTAEENAYILHHSILAYQMDFPRVQWGFFWTREAAERAALYLLWRYWRKRNGRTRNKKAAAATDPDVRPDPGETAEGKDG